MSLECMVRFARNKSSVNKVVDLFHIWPEPPTLPVTLAVNFQGQILKLPYFRNIWPHCKDIKECEFFGWVDILFVDNIWSTFGFYYMLQCRPDVTFLSMVTLVRSYHYRDGDCVYLCHNTSLCVVLGFTSYTHQPHMKFAQFYVTRTQKMCELWFMIHYTCLKIIETQTGWWRTVLAPIIPYDREWKRNVVDEYSIVGFKKE